MLVNSLVKGEQLSVEILPFCESFTFLFLHNIGASVRDGIENACHCILLWVILGLAFSHQRKE